MSIVMLVGNVLQITEGSGRILVVAVGENSEWGKTLSLVSGEGDETPLQEKLGELAGAIGKVGFLVAALSFVVLFIRWVHWSGLLCASSTFVFEVHAKSC